MAKHKGDPGGGEKGTVKFMFFELSGSDSTLQEAVKTLQSAIARAIPSNGLPPAVMVKKGNSLTAGTAAAASDDAALTDLEDIEAEVTVEEDSELPESRGRKEPRKYSLPAAIPVEFTSGMTFREFAAQYKLETDQDKYLAIVAWLGEHRSTPTRAGHILTMYKHMDWTLQRDITMPFRRLIQSQYQWLAKTSRGEYEVGALGADRLAKIKV